MAAGDLVHGLEFLFGGLKTGLQAGGLAGPAFAAGFGDPGLEVVADLQQPGFLGWIRPELRAPDAALTEMIFKVSARPGGFIAHGR